MRAGFTLAFASLGLATVPASAQQADVPAEAIPAAPAPIQSPPVQSAAEALAQDAGEYARNHDVPLDEAMRRLAAQERSVAATDAIRSEFAERLAGIAVEHRPDYRIVVLLTGDEPVPARTVQAGGMIVPVEFRTGARATREEVVAAMWTYRDSIRGLVPRPQGMGLDQRTGELVLMTRSSLEDIRDVEALDAVLEALTGVPVRLRSLDGRTADMVEGGGRVIGTDPADNRRYACTTGFVVTDGARTGIVTAAHCPDALSYVGADGSTTPLEFVGGWGARHQDVQVHVGGAASGPFFRANGREGKARRLSSWRNRLSTRAGDSVCRRGETSGYSCAEVELTDFAPPGDLCGGPCDPVWVTVSGPQCRGGDSGGPNFVGTIAFGITKGGQYYPDGRCAFYYYMSTDYLPDGWRLLY